MALHGLCAYGSLIHLTTHIQTLVYLVCLFFPPWVYLGRARSTCRCLPLPTSSGSIHRPCTSAGGNIISSYIPDFADMDIVADVGLFRITRDGRIKPEVVAAGDQVKMAFLGLFDIFLSLAASCTEI